MDKNLATVKTMIYDQLALRISDLRYEDEGVEYDACQFHLNGKKVISRSSKITPKKVGQFVTFWKRNQNGETEPYAQNDPFDFYVINVKSGDRLGQFVFPKSELVDQGYIKSDRKEGKRGFRVYPAWDVPPNKQAEKTQKWQMNFFYEVSPTTDLNEVRGLYDNKQESVR